jgi:hypothetical protein
MAATMADVMVATLKASRAGPSRPSPQRGASGEPGARATSGPANVDERRTATAVSTPRTRCGIT